MNAKQRAHYHSVLWPEACRTQCWSIKDKEQRRLVTLKATGQESSTGLNEDQISQLFDCLRQLAAGRELDAELTAQQTPEEMRERNMCRQLLWQIDQMKATFSDEYITEVAAWRCREAQVADWRRLPSAELVKVLYTLNTRARAQKEKAGTPVVRTGPRKSATATSRLAPKQKLAKRGTTPAKTSPERVEQPF